MSGLCFNPFRLRWSLRSKLPLEPSLPNLPCNPSSSKTNRYAEAETMEKKRFDSMESWSMILESENVETWEASKGEREEWTADLSQLFIGNKFASGAHSRIYRGIYKQRAVAVKMVRIPTHKEETRAKLEQQFKSEVALLSRLFHPNIVQVCIVYLLIKTCSFHYQEVISLREKKNRAKIIGFRKYVSLQGLKFLLISSFILIYSSLRRARNRRCTAL